MKKIAANRNYRLSKRALDQGQKVYILERTDPDNSGMFEGVFSSQELAMEYAKTLTYGISLDKRFRIIDPTLDAGGHGEVVARFLQSELKEEKRTPDISDFIASRQTPGQWEDANPGLGMEYYRATRGWYKNYWGI